MRTDVGALCENFVVAERIKFLKDKGIDMSYYFGRTTQQQEIDLIEENEDGLTAYEFKWNNKKAVVRFPQTFTGNYRKQRL